MNEIEELVPGEWYINGKLRRGINYERGREILREETQSSEKMQSLPQKEHPSERITIPNYANRQKM